MSARLIALCCLAVWIISSAAFAAEPAGRITALKGTVTLARPAEAAPWSPHAGDGVFPKDVITTGAGSSAKILFKGGVLIVIGERSSVELDALLYAPDEGKRSAVFRLGTGMVRALVEALTVPHDEVSVASSNAIAGARGTDLVVDATRKEVTDVYVLEGNVEVRNIDPSVAGSQLVATGLMCSVVGGSPPGPPRPFSDETRLRLSESLWLADEPKSMPPASADRGLLGRPGGAVSGAAEAGQRIITEQLTGESGSPQVQKVGQDFIVPGKLSVPPSVPGAASAPGTAPGPAGPSERRPDRSRAPELF